MKSEKEKQLEIQLLTEKIQNISGKKVIFKEEFNIEEEDDYYLITSLEDEIETEAFIDNSKYIQNKFPNEKVLKIDCVYNNDFFKKFIGFLKKNNIKYNIRKARLDNFCRININVKDLKSTNILKENEEKTYKISKTYNDKTKVIEDTLEGLIKYFSYTLESGKSHNSSIDKRPKTINSLISNLRKAFDELEGGFSRTSIRLIKENVEVLKETMSAIPPVKSKTSDLENLRAAIIAEYDAINLYDQMANNTKNSKIKEVLLDIAKEEKTHVGELEALLKDFDKQHAEEVVSGEKEVKKALKEEKTTVLKEAINPSSWNMTNVANKVESYANEKNIPFAKFKIERKPYGYGATRTTAKLKIGSNIILMKVDKVPGMGNNANDLEVYMIDPQDESKGIKISNWCYLSDIPKFLDKWFESSQVSSDIKTMSKEEVEKLKSDLKKARIENNEEISDDQAFDIAENIINENPGLKEYLTSIGIKDIQGYIANWI